MPSSQCCLPATGPIADLTQEDRDDLSAFGTFHNAKPETVLIEEGKPHGKLFYTISGHLEARRMDNGRSVLLGSIHDGEWIGEVDLVDPSSALCSVVAVEETQYWEISRKELEKFINKNTAAGSVLLIGLAATLGRRIRAVTVKHASAPAPKKKPYLLLGFMALSMAAIVAFLFLIQQKQEEIVKLKEPSRGLAQLQESLDFSRQRTIELEAEYAKLNEDLNSKEQEAQASKGELEALKAEEKTLRSQLAAVPSSAAPKSADTQGVTPPVPLSQVVAPQQSKANEVTAGYTPLEFPPEVTLLEQMTIPLKVGSKVSGSLKLQSGKILQVTGVDNEDLLVNMGASTERIPKDKTDFKQALAKADLAAKEQYKIRQQFEQAHAKIVAEAIEPKVDEKSSPDKLTPTEPKEFTFSEIEKIVKLVDPLKVLNSLKGANKDSVLRSEARKWREASEMVKSYFEAFDVPQEYTRWLKTVLLTAEMFETGRFESIEPKLRELDVAWLTFKTDQEVRDSQSRANSKDSE